MALKQATAVIPIIFATAGDPVGNKLVASLARPGGNVTGLATLAADLAAENESKFYANLFPVSTDWRSWEMLAIPSLCWS